MWGGRSSELIEGEPGLVEPASFATPLTHNHAPFPSPAPTLCHRKEEGRYPAARGHAYHLHDTPKRTPVTAYFPARLIKHHLLPIPLPYLPSHCKLRRERAQLELFRAPDTEDKGVCNAERWEEFAKGSNNNYRCLLTVLTFIYIRV